MKQNEVDLIYDYLHENYEYRDDGNLIAIKKTLSKNIGDVLGVFCVNKRTGYATLRTHIKHKHVSKVFQLHHLIYLFHHKIKPERVIFLDNNKTNTRIENLRAAGIIGTNLLPSEKINGYTIVKKLDKIFYRAVIQINNEKIVMGQYKTKEEAKFIYDECKKILRKKLLTKKELKEAIKKLIPWAKIKVEKNKTGYSNVCKNKNKYQARLWNGSRYINLGFFDSPHEAHQVYLKAKADHETT
jgi:hypothetical protein